MDVWAAAGERQRTHGDLINLSAGQPSTPAPRPVRAAAAAALERDVLGYTVALGIPELRAGVAAHYGHVHGLAVDPADVVLTTGSSGGFLLAFLAAFDVGDRVAMARPGYPCYRNILTALGCEVVELPCGPQTRHQPTVAMLEELDGIDGLVVASPANPTGTVLPPDELAALAAYCERAGIQLVSDEIYHGISYPGAPATSRAWATSREAIVVNSFSKYFSMTGWRLGWLLVPERLRRAVDRLTGNFTICPPALAQRAAVAAFTPEGYAEADGHVARYAANRALLLDGLAGLGIDRLRARRRRLLRLRRRRAPHRRLDGLDLPAARRDRRGAGAGRRLRPRRRAPVGAVLVRGCDGGRHRGAGAPGGLDVAR